MHPRKGYRALAFRSVRKADTNIIHNVELAPEQSERFFDPIEEIARHVRCGPSHTLVLIEADGASAGFFVLRPDHRTTAAWWLAWLAIGLEHQGAGLGRAALGNALRRLQNVPSIRFVRLLVVRENEGARRLYDAAGFRVVGTQQGGTELIMELALNRGQTRVFEASGKAEATCFLGRHRRFRIRPRSGRHIAPVIGTERGPPVGCSTSAASRRASRYRRALYELSAMGHARAAARLGARDRCALAGSTRAAATFPTSLQPCLSAPPTADIAARRPPAALQLWQEGAPSGHSGAVATPDCSAGAA